MTSLGRYHKRDVFWLDYSENKFSELPEGNWLIFVIEDELPDFKSFEKFVNNALDNGILEFKAFGKDSSKLDDWFDEIMVYRNMMGNQNFDVMTTWHNKETLADAFWQCFHATSVPKDLGNNNLQILCFHFNNRNMSDELKNYLEKFNQGWIPE